VEKVSSRVPNTPLSMTAVRDSVPRAFCSVMWCGTPSSRTRRSLQRGSGGPVFDRSARDRSVETGPGTTTEDRC
jgi:hypothetical protein